MNKLTAKQERFCEEYLRDLNAARSARDAGYSKRTAKEIGDQLLARPQVQAWLEAAMRARSERTQVDADWVLLQLVDNVNRAKQATPVVDRDGQPTGEYRWDGGVANRALELIGKHLGMFEDISKIINLDITKMTPDQRRSRIDELISKRGA